MRTVPSGDIAMPVLGFGTWQLEGPIAQEMTEAALETGYRHLDTAQIYGNEAQVGAGLAASGVPREQVFLTTKVWTEHFGDGDMQRSVEVSLKKLRVDHVDLLLLHWPKPNPPLAETMRALNDVKARGWTRGIGLSNFPSALMRQAASLSQSPLATNQVEHHPYLSQKQVAQTCRELGASLTAWSPIAQGKVVGDPVIEPIARAHGKTAVQVTLRWLIQQPGVVAIPRSSKAERVAENFDIFDFELSDEEMARISALARPDGRIGDWIDRAFQWDKD